MVNDVLLDTRILTADERAKFMEGVPTSAMRDCHDDIAGSFTLPKEGKIYLVQNRKGGGAVLAEVVPVADFI